MKLKYYLRGLGIGILVTAIIMSVAMSGKSEKLTNEQIIERAKSLGMIEDTVLSDALSSNAESENMSKNEISSNESTSVNASAESVSKANVDKEMVPSQVESAVISQNTTISNNDVSENAVEEKDAVVNENKEVESKTITISSGEGSLAISKKLELAGLVESAIKYDKYLCSNGYDKKLCTGNHMIKIGASEEEIAKILSSRE